MSVYVAIPSYNRKDMLDRCLECFEHQDLPPGLIVVCNASSTDGTEAMLAERHPAVLSLRCTDDNWWTGTINVCIREILKRCTPDDYILCINDDVEVGPEYVGRMLAAVSKAPKRGVGSVFVDIDNPDVIEDGGNWQNLLTASFRKFNQGTRLSSFPSDHEVNINVVSGRGCIYPVQAFQELGLFAPELLSLAADYEFGLRCHRAGYDLVVNYGCVVRGDVKPTSIGARKDSISLKGLWNYYSSPRSAANLRERFIYARLATRNPIHALWLFGLMFGRTTWRYFAGPKKSWPDEPATQAYGP